MAIIFENIDTGETVAIDSKREGKYFRAKLSAVINSSNLSINADRGQDYGWRLSPEQQALIEEWEEDPVMIDKVAQYTKVMSDALTHADFLAYLLYQEELSVKKEQKDLNARREAQAAYEARVSALRKQEVPEPMAPFDASKAYDNSKYDSFEDFMLSDGEGKAPDEEADKGDVVGENLPSTSSNIAVDTTEAGKSEPVTVKPKAQKPAKK